MHRLLFVLLVTMASAFVEGSCPALAETRQLPEQAAPATATPAETTPARAATTESSETVLPRRGICAHRGASATHPENTVTALREAVRLGAHMVEFDVALTRDEHVVLMHDSTIDRTTTGSGKLVDFSLPELRVLDAGAWRGAQFVGEKIPTFVEVLAVLPTNIWLNVHLKGGDLLAQKTTRQLRDANRLRQAFLAGSLDSARAAKRIVPNIRICNMDRQTEPARYVQQTLQAEAEFIQLLGSQPGSLRQLPLLRQHPVRINWCCTNDAAELRTLFAAGAEFVLVDEVAKMLDVAENLGIERLRPLFRERPVTRVK